MLADRQKEFAAYLIAGFPELGLQGWSKRGAAAVVGNASQESLVNPVTGAKDHGSDGALQWRNARPGRPGRLDDMQHWCTQHFGDWKSIKAQAAFTMHETARDHHNLDHALRIGIESTSVLTRRFCDVFEVPNPAYANYSNRIRQANLTLKMIA